jgi:hypothetical protein
MSVPLVKTVLFVHGYSVRTLNSWGRLPALLQSDGFSAASIYLSAFVTLDDFITCDDLAAALEAQVTALKIDLPSTAIIAHSTGAIVVRRWLLNRRASGASMPGRFISAAGANHGSPVAQLGATELAYVFRSLTEHSSVGKRVLVDLDFGSDFLRKLNIEWLQAWNAPSPLYAQTLCFSMGGTDHSFWQNQLSPTAHEAGSDGTVRISGASLNFRCIDVAPPYQGWTVTTLSQRCPHLVIETPAKKYSHTSCSATDTLGLVMSPLTSIINTITHAGRPPEPVSSVVYGILEGIQSQDERPYKAIKEAFGVADTAEYAILAQNWDTETSEWNAANPDQANATVVVSIEDEFGHIVDDSLVVIQDGLGGIASIAASLLPNGQIRNAAMPSIVSLYVNAPTFLATHPHKIHAEARTDTPYVDYGFSVDADLSGGNDHTLAPNETTYIRIRVSRDPRQAFAFYSFGDPDWNAIENTAYPPFP